MSSLPILWTRSKEKPRRMFGASPLVRAQRIRDDAARLNRQTLVRPAKCYAPLLSPQKVSGAKHNGGAVADVAIQMLACPDAALRVAMHLLGVARGITQTADLRPLAVLLCEEQRPDGKEDDAQVDLLRDENPETLRTYIERADEAMAALQRSRDAAARRLAELERTS
jgi:hypothetical protein